MIYRPLFDRAAPNRRPVQAGIIGTGHYATAILTQSRSIPALDVPVVADVNVDAARHALHLAGWSDAQMTVCDTENAARAALQAGLRVIVPDASLMMALPLEIIAEATGIAAAGALHAREAIKHGKHVAMITKETDAAVGPILKRKADAAGLVYTAVDGDQHGLLMGLVSWARELGLEIICGGKALEFDVIYDASKGIVTCDGAERPAGGVFGPAAVKAAAEASRIRRLELGPLCPLMGYDVTEMTLAVNGTGLAPDIDALHCPVLRIPEIAEVLTSRARGGILSKAGAVDAIACLRTPFEPGLAGGVFVVVGCASEYSRKILLAKGHLANHCGDSFLIFRPHHLCGVETPLSLLTAVRLGVPTGATDLRPIYDVLAEARGPLRAGGIVPTDKSSEIRALMRPATPRSSGHPIPLHIASGCSLRVGVPAGTVLRYEHVIPPASSALWELRREQDDLFFKS